MSKPFYPMSAATIQSNFARRLSRAGFFALLLTLSPSVLHGQQVPAGHTAKTGDGQRVTHATTPLSFVRNAGQDPTGAQYLAHGPGYSMRLSPGSVELSLLCGATRRKPDAIGSERDKPEVARLGMSFAGANPNTKLEMAEQLPGTESYFIGRDEKNWHTDLPTYAKLRYREIYPGIDLAFHGDGTGNPSSDGRPGAGKFEYDIELAPHADSSLIAIKLDHAERAEIDKDGNLQLSVGGSPLRFLKPVAWQVPQNGTARKPVEVSYRLKLGRNGAPAVLSFETGKYDHGQALVIDPVLDYATYLNLYSETAMTVDSSGNVYVTGQDPSNSSYAFDVLKFNSAGTLVYTAVVQNASNTGYGYSDSIAVDSSGEAYVAGFAGPDWPTTSNAYQAQNGYASQGNPYFYNSYLVKLNAAGSSISYASYLGGSNSPYSNADYPVAMAVDTSGNAYMTGIAYSTNFPTTTAAFQTALPANGGSSAAFIAKFNPTLSGAKSLVYSTFFGDQNTFESSIAVDSSGNAYLAGHASNQYNSTLAATPGAFAYVGLQSSSQEGAYVAKLNPAGSALVYSAYLGYVGNGNGFGVAVDGSGDVYVTGSVGVEDFPTTSGAYQTSYPSGFAAELNPAGSAEIYSTFLSGPSGATTNYIYPHTIAIPPGCTSACAAYIAGTTSYTTDFPQINSIQTTPSAGGYYSGFLVALNGTGTAATLSTYIGGFNSYNNAEQVYNASYLEQTPSVAVDPSGNIYYSAVMTSPDFPVTTSAGAFGAYYPYLAKIGPAAGGIVVAYPTSVNLGNTYVNTSSAVYSNSGAPTVTLRNMGSSPVTLTSISASSTIYSQTNTCGGTIPGGGQCTLTPAFTPTVSGAVSGTLTIASTGTGSPLTINLSGNANDGAYLQASTTALNFNTQTVGTASAFQTITLKNTGDQAVTGLTLYNLPVGFTALNDCPGSISPGQSCQYGFQFSPYEAGYVTGTPYLNGSFTNIDIALSGTGVVSGAAGSLTLTATALNYGTEAVGTVSSVLYPTITNTGTVPVTINPYTVTLTSSQGSAADFGIANYSCQPPPFIMQPGSTCTLYTNFVPSAAGTETATLTVPSSAGSATIALTGIGAADNPTLVFSPQNYVFADQAVGTASGPQYFYVYNGGNYPIFFDRVYATGDFQLQGQSCAGTTLNPSAPGATEGYCYVYVVFAPSALGNRTGTVTFVDTDGGTQTLSLSGTGIAATGSLTVDQPALNFPAQAVGTTGATQIATFTNNGNSAVYINSFSITGDYTATGYGNYCGTVTATSSCYVPPGGYLQATISFTPSSATNPRTGTLTVNSTAGVVTTSLSGIGETASQAVSLTPSTSTTLSFGSIVTGQTSQFIVVYLHNTGTEAVSIPSVPIVSGAAFIAYDEGYEGGCGYYVITLNPGAECEVYMQFAPTSTGTQTGTLTFTDSAGTQTLKLTGVGVSTAPVGYFQQASYTYQQTWVGTGADSFDPYVGNYYENFYNSGTNPLTIASDAITAGGASYSSNPFNDTCAGAVLSTGQSCHVEVIFGPTTSGYQTGTFTITDSTGNIYSTPLYGYSPSVLDDGYLTPDGIGFSTQNVGNVSTAQTITLNNGGTTSISIGAVTGTNVGPGSEFSITYDNCSNGYVSTNMCSVNVTFTPSASGARAGQLSFPVTYTDGTTATLTAKLTGTGAGQSTQAILSPLSTQFSSTIVGQTSAYQTIRLSNPGTQPFIVGFLSGTNTTINATSPGDFTTTDYCSGAYIGGGSSCYVNVYFAPQAGAPAVRSGSLTFPVTYLGATTATNLTATYSGSAIASASSLVVTPSSLQLGTWIVGTNSSTQTITVSNNGAAPVTFGSITVAAPFYTNYGCGGVLAVNASCSMTVLYRPSATGAATGTLNLPNNATGSVQKVTLSGTGIPASEQLVWSQSTVAFGSTVVGTSSNQVSITLINRSSQNVTVNSVNIGGTNAVDFAEVSSGCYGATLYGSNYYGGAYSSCTVVLQFTPGSTATGALAATVTETDNGTGSPRSVSLTGTGINPTPTVGIFPASLMFTTQNIGTKSSGQTFSVTNTGSGSLKITTVASTGSTEFAISSNACTGVTLAAGADCLVSVTFAPTSGGSHSGTISVTDNASGSPQAVALTGLVPQASLSVSSLSFGNQNVGTSSGAQTATLTNGGTGTLAIASISVGGTNATDFASTNTCGNYLSAGASCSISITFGPKAAGSLTASLTVNDDAGLAAGSTQTISLSGTGVAVAATPTFTPAAGTYTATQSVTIADTTSGATIYYTTNGTTPTTSSTKYAGIITVSASETIEAIAVATGYSQSATATAVYTITTPAATPTFTPAAGSYTATQSVTIADATSGATIYYTTNGTTPTTASTKYTGAITVSTSETIEAIAVATGYSQSATATAAYTITPQAATPTFTPVAGSYTATQSVTIADTTSGATIYYTTNGTTPTTSSTKYTGAITVSATETIEAIAVATGYSQSATATAAYTITATTATPTFTPAAGTYPGTESVSIKDATGGATIYYTTNGTTPTTSSTKYSGLISVSANETIKAIAVATGYAQSAVATATYTIMAATPTFTPAAGTYTGTQSVKIADATSGATIYYTTNGTTPTTSSTKYSGLISVSATETIEAIAVATGYGQSAVATAKYTITP